MAVKVKNLFKDVLPRFVAVLIVVAIGFVSLMTLDYKARMHWTPIVQKISNESSILAGTWLDEKIKLAHGLVEDGRINNAFEVSGDASAQTRRALYEFSYLNSIQFVYLFSVKDKQVIASAAGSPILPHQAIDKLVTAARTESPYIVSIISLDNSPYIIVAKAVRSDTGFIVGYVSYLQPVQNAFLSLKFPEAHILARLELTLYKLGSLGVASVVDNYTRIPPVLQTITVDSIKSPIFLEDSISINKNVRGEQALISFSTVPAYSGWRVSAAITMPELRKDNMLWHRLIEFMVGIISLIIILRPPKQNNAYALWLYRYLGWLGIYKPNDIVDKKPSLADKKPIKNEDIPKRIMPTAPSLANPPPKKTEYAPSEAVIAYNIRTSIKQNRFKLLYQPIMDLVTDKPIMYEVFSRIIDEEGEIMPPNMFLPVAHKEELVSLIDEAVISSAVEGNFINKEDAPIPLAINLAGDTFESITFLETLMNSIIKQADISNLLVFELRSREIIEDPRAMDFIRECHGMGIKFSVDYFGGGTQTLKAAKTLKFDYIKVDAMRFDENDKESLKELVKLIKMSDAIELPMVIEKVESARLLNFIKQVGAKYAQGYYLGRPSETME